MELIAIKEHYFPTFDRRKPILIGDKLVPVTRERYNIIAPDGWIKGEVGLDIARKVGRPPKKENGLLKAIGEQLRAAREFRGLRQDDVAERMNVSKQYLSNIENGRASVSLQQLSEICDILKYEVKVKLSKRHGK